MRSFFSFFSFLFPLVIGDNKGHIDFDVKHSKAIATATRTAIILGKFAMLLAQLNYWSNISVSLTRYFAK